MKLNEAMILVRDKYLEEQKGPGGSSFLNKYNAAWKQFPATMRIAHHLFAVEMAKTS
jgi:hypothetical protein